MPTATIADVFPPTADVVLVPADGRPVTAHSAGPTGVLTLEDLLEGRYLAIGRRGDGSWQRTAIVYSNAGGLGVRAFDWSARRRGRR